MNRTAIQLIVRNSWQDGLKLRRSLPEPAAAGADVLWVGIAANNLHIAADAGGREYRLCSSSDEENLDDEEEKEIALALIR
jgi:hypothetical protein